MDESRRKKKTPRCAIGHARSSRKLWNPVFTDDTLGQASNGRFFNFHADDWLGGRSPLRGWSQIFRVFSWLDSHLGCISYPFTVTCDRGQLLNAELSAFNHIGSHSSHTLQSTSIHFPCFTCPLKTPPATVTWINQTYPPHSSLASTPSRTQASLPASLSFSHTPLPSLTHLPPPSLYLASRSSIVYQSRHVSQSTPPAKKVEAASQSRYRVPFFYNTNPRPSSKPDAVHPRCITIQAFQATSAASEA